MDKSFVEKLGYAALVAVAVVLGFLLRSPADASRAPVAQPSVPSLVPPHCDGSCRSPQVARPYTVACPYCRNRLTVTPPRAGEVGEVTKAEAGPK